MQFVPNGPDIPEALLQAHEEGRVVFFCGAGISYPAGLPDFKGLVEKIYDLNGTTFSNIEREAFGRDQFDATLDLLERRIPGQRLAVRSKLAQALKPKLRRNGATDTQAALLRLARSREGTLRLVTTNFDRVFHVAAKRTNQTFQTYTAPMLPIPKNSRWDGLVYLHGLLPEKMDDTALNRLVVTSGDFGLAYLTERWAARFISELFRNYIVCFVGYSINDPVLRYMMDALAADRMLGEITPLAWALGACEVGLASRKIIEWEAKGVIPILYNVPIGSHDHSVLHQTLQVWANIYRDGISGKESIIAQHALTQPSASTQQDDFVGRMLWALSDRSGLPAKHFAEFNPAPPLEWLFEVFSDARFRHSHLSQFGVPPHDKVDGDLKFSLIHRPAPYDKVPRMALVSVGGTESGWDAVMIQLARWLNRYLGDPRLILWIAERGGKLHVNWQIMIEQELNRFANLERDGKTVELDDIRAQSPKAIPGRLMRMLWDLLLGGRAKGANRSTELYRWKLRFEREEMTASLRFELRELLAPRIVLRQPYRGNFDNGITNEPTALNQLVRWDLVLAARDLYSIMRELRENERWQSALPLLLEDFQHLLRDALDLQRDLGDADDKSDRSFWDLPSITPHYQNRGYREWVALIELLRDAWLVLFAVDAARATRIAQDWFALPYPTFKRMALFAASQPGCIAPEQWVDWLLVEDAWWLWSVETNREVCRLLVLQGQQLSQADQERLAVAVLAGRPLSMLNGQPEPEWWAEDVSQAIWLRLAKLDSSGLMLGTPAAKRLAELHNTHPQWKLTENGIEREEFSRWMSASGDPEFESRRVVDVAPRKCRELVPWLKKSPTQWVPLYEDTWDQVCRKHLLNSLYALYDLAQEGVWPVDRWNQAFYVWSQGRLLPRSWRYIPSLLQTIPDANLQKIAYSLSWWIESVSKTIDQQENVLLEWCHRVLALDLDADSGSRTVRNGVETIDITAAALNHPVGHVTQALLNVWFKRKPNDGDGLPADIQPLLTDICRQQAGRFRHGRVVLASQVIALFRADRAWTEQCLLPWFSWSSPTDAQAMWQGFLWAPRVHQPLLVAIKRQFLDCAEHYADLGEYGQQFAAVLTYVALERIEGYFVVDFRTAIRFLPASGLEACAQALLQALRGAGDQREQYWSNRVLLFWEHIWPKSRDLITPKISEFMALLSISAGAEFPAALNEVEHWLQPLNELSIVVSALSESQLCSRFPTDALRLLDKVIDNPQWMISVEKLCQCLDSIVGSDPTLKDDPRFTRLNQLRNWPGG
ncbi:MAG: SIR2 family protein [Betaproteobacteria bacterium]|jgi:hypothetical protein|nr:SIR2 family protein [Betaproteobacteria bacterium]